MAGRWLRAGLDVSSVDDELRAAVDRSGSVVEARALAAVRSALWMDGGAGSAFMGVSVDGTADGNR